MSVMPKAGDWYGASDLAHVPEPPDWRTCIHSKPSLERELNVSCPCIGLNNGGRALQMLGVSYKLVNPCDLIEHLNTCLADLEGSLEGVSLGESAGDMTKMDLKSLTKPVDILLAGPPCPPFASNGNRNPANDNRTHVFYSVLLWVIHFVRHAGLLYVLIENVMGAVAKLNKGKESFIDIALELLNTECPEMVWRVDSLDAADYMLAHSRSRVFLQGVRVLIW